MGLINIYPSSVHLEWENQRQKNEASQTTAPEQLRDSHSATARAELEDSIGEELTTQSLRDQALSSRDKGINDESKSI